jgi:hypothetical protein
MTMAVIFQRAVRDEYKADSPVKEFFEIEMPSPPNHPPPPPSCQCAGNLIFVNMWRLLANM